MVDVVYTWVDGSDARWLEKKNSALSLVDPEAASRSSSAVSDSRFCNRDELKYSLRSLEKFAGFVTRIHIVTDHQIPSWLDTAHPDIQLVSHEAIFANADDLPTFNSHAIEANLHRIESLSERYIYLNDDFTFYAPCGESDFFDSSGRAVIYFDHRKVVRRPWCFGYDSPVNAAARNNSRLLESLAFSPITHRLDHVPYALRKSVIEELWEKFPDQL